jgi:hypothetical protein
MAPADLAELAVWLKKIPLDQRNQFIRERVTGLSLKNAATRAKIRAFLLNGADVEIERPGDHAILSEFGTTSLRRYFLDQLDDFPASEAVPIAREILATSPDFQVAYLCLRTLEHHQPDANRPDALEAMRRVLPAAAQPAKPGRDTERYLATYDRLAEPIAHYRLAELQPLATQVLAANPFMAGRYTQALESFEPAQRESALNEIFAQPDVVREMLGSSGSRSANIWMDPGFRARTARFFASQMAPAQRLSLITSLSEDTGARYASRPLAESKIPTLQPIDSAAEANSAKARLAMLDALAPHATTPELKTALENSRTEVAKEAAAPAEPPLRRKPIVLPNLDPLGAPASALDSLPEDAPAAPVTPPASPNPPVPAGQ